jgi:hypothetical protein
LTRIWKHVRSDDDRIRHRAPTVRNVAGDLEVVNLVAADRGVDGRAAGDRLVETVPAANRGTTIRRKAF